MPAHFTKEIDKHLDDMLERGVIEPSYSPWSAPVVLVKKNGPYRFCINYRKLNSNTIKDACPLPRFDESLDQLSGSSWFSTLDLCSGYWHVEIDQEDKPKPLFGLHRDICLVYLDDIIVTGKKFEEILSNLMKVFDRLKGVGLKLKAKKCCLFANKVTYFGHVVWAEGEATDPAKTGAVEH